MARTLPRERIRLAQTPQAFRIGWLRRALARAGARGVEGTDDASLVAAAGYRVRVVAGSPLNFKVTTPEDVAWLRALLRRGASRPRRPSGGSRMVITRGG